MLGFSRHKHNPHASAAAAIPGDARIESPKPFFRAALRNDGTFELLVYEEIGENWWTGGGITAKSFKDQLDRASGPYSRIVLRINSPGGDAFEGVAILNMLRATGKQIKVCVDGLAASAASIIAMAGDEIEMGDGAMMMIHNAWSICIGPASDMTKQANALNAIDESIAQVYANKTGLKKAELLDMMAAETWLTAADCVKQGFATAKAAKRGAALPDAPEPLAMAKRGFRKALASYRNVPTQFRDAAAPPRNATPEEPDQDACLCACKACKDDLDCTNCTDTTCNDKNCTGCPMQEEREIASARGQRHILLVSEELFGELAVPRLVAMMAAGNHLGTEVACDKGASILALRRGACVLNLAPDAEGGVAIARVKGLLAPYNSPSGDLGGFVEIYQPGCFAEFLKTDDPRVLYNHNIDSILGRKSAGTARFWEEPDGLHYDADLPDTQAGRDVRVLLERGDIKESSAAFYIYQYRWEQRGEVRTRVVEKARLVEGSPHTFAAYGSATAEPGEVPANAENELEQLELKSRFLSVA